MLQEKATHGHNDQQPSLHDKARRTIEYWVDLANQELAPNSDIPMPEICFDLRGRTAGMACWKRERATSRMKIRVNAQLLHDNTEQIIKQTLPHEVAHVVTRHVYGRNVRPHGPEWKPVMTHFGKPATRCHQMETTPARKVRKFKYKCDYDKEHEFGAVRHKRARQGTRYFCKTCRQTLVHAG